MMKQLFCFALLLCALFSSTHLIAQDAISTDTAQRASCSPNPWSPELKECSCDHNGSPGESKSCSGWLKDVCGSNADGSIKGSCSFGKTNSSCSC